MGEEEKPKGGEKEKEKEKEKENKGDGGAENKKKEKEKKDESPPIIVLRTDLHCEGCAMKVKRAIRSLPGVDAVSADAGSNRVTVTGPADPWEVKERIEAKTKRKVEFVSPANPPKKDKDNKVGGDKKPGADPPKQPPKDAAAAAAAKGDDQKPKEPPESTVMLKIRLHCEGCIDRIKRRIYKVKGVKEVTVDAAKDLITVKGTMDVNTLPSYLQQKFRRSVEIVPAKKDAGGGDKGDKDKDKEKEKKGDGGGGGDKKKEEKKDEKGAGGGGGGGGEKGAAAPPPAAPASAEVNRYDYYAPYGYRVEMGHAPQIFSDENPNACAVM
ncbi:heavy metal-associated isoprenylated plant protein 3-like [Ananas comosus]|uniref:Heavy metal-associated isoprenylated plant protein 3-like n=1 Tax=Ananas comosus TaxID=4615 RepID=A0A6P5FEJ0_ANACO|nr:heavy metal-associated isoprenylated plant protein 3-like [Ananas comosus]